VGDVVGDAGVSAVSEILPKLISSWQLDLVVVNGENAAPSGFGITEDAYRAIVQAGADAVTLGNHSWNRKEALSFIDHSPRLIRPINYLSSAPGEGRLIVEMRNGSRALVINALGRLFMEPTEDPFSRVEQEISTYRLVEDVDATIVDFHCEATGEKQAMGHFCDGRVSLVVGTHTHTPSADHRVLVGGTAFITDVGMTGDYDSVVGMKKREPLARFTRGIPSGRFEPADGAVTLSAVAVEVDDSSGLAVAIEPVRIGGSLTRAIPTFWPALSLIEY
jgi:2',3'-cyclic-nucleotide 2'-phosphodiesterase